MFDLTKINEKMISATIAGMSIVDTIQIGPGMFEEDKHGAVGDTMHDATTFVN